MKFFLRLIFFLDDYYLCKYNSYCFQICVNLLPCETKISEDKKRDDGMRVDNSDVTASAQK